MPHVPLSFTYPDVGEYEGEPSDLLEFVEQDGLVTVRWPLLDLTLVHSKPDSQYGPKLADVGIHTPNFRAHGLYGFSLGQYTEVMVVHEFGQHAQAIVRLGDVELTLGEPTPLLRYLFDRIHWDKYHGQWGEDIQSIRLWMCPPEMAEAYLLEGHAALTKQHGLPLRFCDIFDIMDVPDEGDYPKSLQLDLPAAVIDIEPLRLFYDGYTQSDASTAILQFYRVLEYYSIVNRYGEIDALRRRSDLTTKQFTIEMDKIIVNQERANICRLVVVLAEADTETLKQAVNTKLIDRPEAHLLGTRLYDFRNSIVHAKNDHRMPMFVPSIFEYPPELVAWRHMLDRLARAAIDTLGTRH